MRMPFVVSRFTMPLREAGPLHEPPVCSQMPQLARLAETATPDPELEPRGTRSVSYGLHGCPPHAAYASVLPIRTVFDFSAPSSLDPACAALVMAKLIAPLARKSATSGESRFGASIANFTSLPPVARMSFASYQF